MNFCSVFSVYRPVKWQHKESIAQCERNSNRVFRAITVMKMCCATRRELQCRAVYTRLLDYEIKDRLHQIEQRELTNATVESFY